jgi:transcriptional regulator
MYVPGHFAESDLDAMHHVIRTRPFATWVALVDTTLVVNHIPLLYHEARGASGTLVGHVARANPVWHSLGSSPSVMIFSGAQGYVTPSWYPSKKMTGKAVPTWNYLVVHAHGIAKAIDDREWLRAHVAELTHAHEHQRVSPWQIDDAPAHYIEALLGAIVGIEMPIDKLEGKRKLSQNRAETDLLGIVSGLAAESDPDIEMMQLVSEAMERKRNGDQPAPEQHR